MTKRHDRTFSHLFDQHFHDPHTPKYPSRLRHLGISISRNGWEYVEQLSRSHPIAEITYFPDTNIFINAKSQRFWAGMRLHFLETCNCRVALSGTTHFELSEWLDDPHRNHALSVAVSNAIRSKAGWIEWPELRESDGLLPALHYYITLLGYRRTLLRSVQDGIFHDGPLETSEAMNFIKDNWGLRTQLIAKKGMPKIPSDTTFNLNDEAHVVSALFHAIAKRKEVVIVTCDEDVLECFFKATYMLNMHYHAMHCGRLIKAGHWPTAPRALSDEEGLVFAGQATAYPAPNSNFDFVLPERFRTIYSTCIYIKPDGTATKLSFLLDAEMIELLTTKALTLGNSTQHFGTSNVHIDLGPLKQSAGHCIAIGPDIRVRPFSGSYEVGLLDLNHVVFSKERFGANRRPMHHKSGKDGNC